MGLARWFRTFYGNIQVKNGATISDRRRNITKWLNTDIWAPTPDTADGALQQWEEMTSPTRRTTSHYPISCEPPSRDLMVASKDGSFPTTCLSPVRAIVDDQEEEPGGPVR